MRVSIDGGTPELIMSGRFYTGIRCAWLPANSCVSAEQSDDRQQLIFSAFDPIEGRQRELCRMNVDRDKSYNWNVSKDGVYVMAAIAGAQSKLLLRRTDGRPAHDIGGKGWPGLNNIDFSADSKGVFMNSTSNGVATLLYVDLAGNAHPLWQPKYPTVSNAEPSRDGYHLAITGESDSSNLWMLRDF
jgi:hypothetical protein